MKRIHMASDNNDRRPTRRRTPVLFGIVTFFVVIVIPVVAIYYLVGHRRTTDVAIPNPTLPHPNAYDYYVAAEQAVVPGRLGQKKVSLANPRTQAEAATELKGNARAFALLRHGFQFPYYEPPIRSFTDQRPYHSTCLLLARELSLESRLAAVHNDWSTAMNSSIDAVQMGQSIVRGNTLLGELHGLGSQAIGRKPLWNTVVHLNRAECSQAIRRLEVVEQLHVPFSDVLQEEEWYWLASVDKDLNGKLNPEWHLDWGKGGTGIGWKRDAVSKATVLAHVKAHFQAAILAARGPYDTKPQVTETDFIANTYTSDYTQDRLLNASAEAQTRLLLVSIALRAYHLDHGAYPAQLGALIPPYLPSIPLDPFAANRPLLYYLKGNGYTLYSVGPDIKDDHGRPIFDPKAPVAQSKRVVPGSIGDIVAGVNF